jgi:hypothetical protein
MVRQACFSDADRDRTGPVNLDHFRSSIRRHRAPGIGKAT